MVFLKERDNLFRRNACSSVFNPEFDPCPIISACSDLDLSPFRSELDRIAYEVMQHLIQPAGIGLNRRKIGLNLLYKRDALMRGQGKISFHIVSDKLMKINPFLAQMNMTSLTLREVKE